MSSQVYCTLPLPPPPPSIKYIFGSLMHRDRLYYISWLPPFLLFSSFFLLLSVWFCLCLICFGFGRLGDWVYPSAVTRPRFSSTAFWCIIYFSNPNSLPLLLLLIKCYTVSSYGSLSSFSCLLWRFKREYDLCFFHSCCAVAL
jgi:hypothetical protein